VITICLRILSTDTCQLCGSQTYDLARLHLCRFARRWPVWNCFNRNHRQI